MRYSIRFPTLLRCCDELEKTARKHVQETDKLRQTRRSLSRLSGMEAVLAGLDREIAEFEDQERVLLAMAQAARRAHQIYTDTENTIISEADCPYHPLTELRLTPQDAGAGGGPSWQVTITGQEPGSESSVIEIERLDVKSCAELLAEMDVVLRSAF